LTFDVASYVLAVGVVLAVKFPAAMAIQRAESVIAEIVNGLKFTFTQPSFRMMILFFAALNLFISPLFVLLSPLVLTFSTLPHVAAVAAVAGVGGVVAGLILTIWGGPPIRRMRAVMITALLLAVSAAVTGLRPNLLVVCLGAFGIAFCIGTANGIILTIIQTKVPQRIQGRIFALNTMIAAITVPIGFGVIAPYGTLALQPLARAGGRVGDVVRAVVGTGPGRAIGLLYVFCGLALVLLVLIAGRIRVIARFDTDVPDAVPDDLLGLQASREHRARRGGATAGGEPAEAVRPAASAPVGQ
jgi:MFS family permease